MWEVELKVPVSDPDICENRIVEEGGKLLFSYLKEDIYFRPKGDNHDLRAFRLRKEVRNNGSPEYVVTYKEKNRVNGIESNAESGFTVSDPRACETLVKVLDQEPYCRKTKVARVFGLRDLQMELVEVPPLGWFLEVEKLVEDPDQIAEARSRLLLGIKPLGFDADDIEPRYYTELLALI